MAVRLFRPTFALALQLAHRVVAKLRRYQERTFRGANLNFRLSIRTMRYSGLTLGADDGLGGSVFEPWSKNGHQAPTIFMGAAATEQLPSASAHQRGANAPGGEPRRKHDISLELHGFPPTDSGKVVLSRFRAMVAVALRRAQCSHSDRR